VPRKRISRLFTWCLPYGLVLSYRKWNALHSETTLPVSLLSSNKALHNIHAGERCFILGNGPSVKDVDLSVLQGETVISVSNGYLHRNFAKFAPRYHCLPNVSYVGKTEADIINWFKEMHEHIGDATLFLNETEAALVREHDLFPGREIHFLALREDFDTWDLKRPIDLTAAVPRVVSVPVMTLMIALYMGFSDIYLLGVDHDDFRSGRYTYAFDLTINKNKDPTVGAHGEVTINNYDMLQIFARLWRQYRALRQLATAKDVRIFNATPGGALDEFPRMTLQDALGKSR